MNERIKELAKRAGGNPNYKAFRGHFLPPPPDYIHPATVDLEKFAKLIVLKCIEQGKQIQSQSVSNGSEDYNTGREMGIEVFMNQIKKHFGVE